jgi:hypothetical protein
MSVPGWEDLDPEEDARRARAREAYAKMYPLSTNDPYGEKRLERVQTPTGIKQVFNQVAREWGLGALIDAQDPEQSRTLEPREIDRNAYRHPIGRERCPRDERSRRRPGWVTCRFVLPGRTAVGAQFAGQEHGRARACGTPQCAARAETTLSPNKEFLRH